MSSDFDDQGKSGQPFTDAALARVKLPETGTYLALWLTKKDFARSASGKTKIQAQAEIPIKRIDGGVWLIAERLAGRWYILERSQLLPDGMSHDEWLGRYFAAFAAGMADHPAAKPAPPS